ncbi:Uncharacterised protein [Legionella busanensis]|uniref:Uncharacterized protein n=1 Tax=Legionella busanensis TaxID=190655 RepID=A0A378JMG1_9GAMM|nr:hypothetical protein [Legionella busanensis]STX52414.1 Uncharacterised protein [Legionella busanensis]
MRSPIYTHYGLNNAKVLLISCYHDKNAAYFIYRSIGNRCKNDELYKFPEMKDPETIPIDSASNLKKEITKKLAAIVNKLGVHNISKVVFFADVNLCVNDYNIAECLLDDTLPKLFAQGGILLERTLESGTLGIVKEGVTVYNHLVKQSKIEFKSALDFREKGKQPIESIKIAESLEQEILAKREEVERTIKEKGVGSVILWLEAALEPDPDPGDNLDSKAEEGEKIEGSDISEGEPQHNAPITSETKGVGSVILMLEPELGPDPDPGGNLDSKSEGKKIEGSDISEGEPQHNAPITSETKGVGSVILMLEPELGPDPDPGDNLDSKSEGEKIEGSDVPEGEPQHNTPISSETQSKAHILNEISKPNDVISHITSQLEEMGLLEDKKEDRKILTQ